MHVHTVKMPHCWKSHVAVQFLVFPASPSSTYVAIIIRVYV